MVPILMDDQSIDVSVLIVNWNAQERLTGCLNSIRQVTDLQVETIVVDNASTDESVALVRAKFPQTRLVLNNENMGFATANNQAAKLARGRYLLLLNPDAEVSPGALDEMVLFSGQNPDVAAIGPRLLNPDGSPQRSGWHGYPGLMTAAIDAFYLWKLPWLPFVRRTELISEPLTSVRSVDHLLGACMLIPREAWDAVGPLDEGYFLFLEETDWCRRARLAGWRLVLLPTVTVVHYGQHSMRQQPSRNLPHLYHSYCRFYRESPGSNRFGIFLLKLTIILAVLIRCVLWLVRALFEGNGLQKNRARTMSKGYLQVLKDLPAM